MTDLAKQYVDAITRGDLLEAVKLERKLDDETRRENDRLAHPDALRKAALWYAKQGVAVFPCQPRGKQPLGQLAPHGLKDATTDVEQIAAWWQAEPRANIGAPTGLTFDVIDIDGPDGVVSTYGAGVDFPPEIGHSLTTREGGHHVFIAPTGAGNRVNLYPSVDYRGTGGYVVLPPSVGANGRRYMWTTPLRVAA